jgi:WD40 repeat protein
MPPSPVATEPLLLNAHGRHAQAVAFSADGNWLVSTGQDACVRLWSVPGFRAEGVFEGHANSVNSLAFSPDGTLLATGSTDATVRVWSFPQGQCRHVLGKQATATFSPDGTQLATISVKGRIVLWDTQTGEEITTLPALDKRALALTFLPDAATLLVGGTGPIHRVRLPEGKKEGELVEHKGMVTCLRLTPDGQLLASTGADATLRLWSTRDWSEVWKVELRAAGVFQIAVAPQGDVVSVGADHLIQTFSLADGKLLGRLDVPVKGVYGVAISPDGRYLVNAAADGKVRVWRRRSSSFNGGEP